MKHEYIAYTKEVNGVLFYFVKHLLAIPEIQNVNPVTTGFGMHTDFEKACTIANIMDPAARKQIFESLPHKKQAEAKVVNMFKANGEDKKIS